MTAQSPQDDKAFWRSLKQRISSRLTSREVVRDHGREQGVAFYNEAFTSVDGYHKHYTESEYYFLWTVIIDRIRRLKVSSILEIGCGTGQLARAIRDSLPAVRYCGLDFSDMAINIARTHAAEMRFEVQNALTTDLTQSCDYDLVISTEFLEHLEADLQVLERLRSGTLFIGTVPNFPYVSHVRHFSSEAAVQERYSALFHTLEVCSFAANAKGKTFYLMQGMLKGDGAYLSAGAEAATGT